MAHRIYGMSVAKVYPAWLAKVQKKGRSRAELDQEPQPRAEGSTT